MDAWGGSDMEASWNSVSATRAWTDGYNSADNWRYVNYGSADGCPTSGSGSCNNGWSQGDVRYVSYGSPPAWPMPEIYRTDGVHASQWDNIQEVAGYMYFLGSLTQWQACFDVGGCDPSTWNSPGAGWQQLWDRVRDDQARLEHSTDITWGN